jgi:hypothetical protein
MRLYVPLQRVNPTSAPFCLHRVKDGTTAHSCSCILLLSFLCFLSNPAVQFAGQEALFPQNQVGLPP